LLISVSIVAVISVAVISACGSSIDDSTPTATPAASAAPVVPAAQANPTSSPSNAATIDTETTETLRQLAFDYWVAFNAYDPDKTLSYLEASYRQRREEEIRDEIGRIKIFNVQLDVSEQIPPQMNGDGTAEMFLMMKEPLGLRRIQMNFLEVNGEWKLTYTEEVE
jgi:hypothetical protein